MFKYANEALFYVNVSQIDRVVKKKKHLLVYSGHILLAFNGFYNLLLTECITYS